VGLSLRAIINAFIEDTCVLVAVAYLLARGRMLSLLFCERLPRWKTASLGAVLGLVGLTEVAFPKAHQLTLLYDERARVRLFSRADRGTLAVFVTPNREKRLGRRPVETP
jgi:hypothetical protein